MYIKQNMREKIINLVIDALLTDGAHHKQWYLEQILLILDVDLEELREQLLMDDYEWEEGIAP